MRFEELNLSAPLLEAIAQLDFTEMTEIQEKAIPLLLEGKDVIGKSNTGTGKTAAFSIPILEQMGQMPQEERRNVCALILCPTRELAMQACDEIRKFSRFQRQIKPVAVYGGASMERQIYQLKNGANLVVGTPGRVLDHLRRRTLKLDNLKTIVLDEADEMLNMGFREDIESVLAQIPEERQTVLFSATMPPAILAITKQYQNDPVLVQIQSAHRTVDAIAQFSVSVPMGRKTDALQLLLLSKQPKSAMIFCNTKKMVDELTEALCLRGFSAAGLHGDMKQLQRTQVMNGFKSGRNTILIATDVAARGIDVKGVDAVFNYDLPQDHEYYIHRIGRTGRAGKTGTAYNILSGRKQEMEMRDISRYTKADITEIPVPTSKELRASATEETRTQLLELAAQPSSEEALALAQELLAQASSPEQLLAALVQKQLDAATKNLPTFDVPKPIRKASVPERKPFGYTSTPDARTGWRPTLSWVRWSRRRAWLATNSARSTFTTSTPPWKCRRQRPTLSLMPCRTRKSTARQFPCGAMKSVITTTVAALTADVAAETADSTASPVTAITSTHAAAAITASGERADIAQQG